MSKKLESLSINLKEYKTSKIQYHRNNLESLMFKFLRIQNSKNVKQKKNLRMQEAIKLQKSLKSTHLPVFNYPRILEVHR